MAEKIKGTVKWFSNRKGFGFITPTSDNAPTTEDIFVHQSNIVTEAEYRTLKDGLEVEFEAITDDNGKLKAQNVTNADGTACPGPEPRERRKRQPKKKEGGESGEDDEDGGGEKVDGEKTGDGDGAEKKGKNNRRRRKNSKSKSGEPAPGSWYAELEETVQKSMESRNIKMDGGRAFLAIGDARMKIGTGGYVSLAHATGILAEGTYAFDKDGKIVASWEHVLKYDGTEWKASSADEEKEALVMEINLTDDSVQPAGAEETTDGLWGEGKIDPKEALESNGFQMRKVALHPTAGGGRRRGRGRQRNTKKSQNKPNGEGKAAEAAE